MNFSQSLKESIDSAKFIAISTHLHPDADGIGSQLGLYMALKKMNKVVFCINEEELPERYSYLDELKIIEPASQFKEKKQNIDLLIVVDTNTIKRVGEKVSSLLSEKTKIIYIDHHPLNKPAIDGQYIDSKAAATGQMIAEIILSFGIEIDAKIALPLYTAILIDTNSFRYPTVNSKTHQVVAKLLATGISPSGAYNKIYGTKSIRHTHFLGEILKNSKSNELGDIAWIHITKELQDEYLISAEESNAFINHLLVLDNIKVACMFREEEDGYLKLSLRSHGNIDVGEIAGFLGGGGHSHSAATRMNTPEKEEDISNLINEIITKIESLLIKG